MRNNVRRLTPRAGSQRDERFNQLLDDVMQRSVYPQDRFEIAALLETMGWNDKRVYEAFGVDGVFDLAEEIWELIQQKIVYASFAKPVEKSKAEMLFEVVKSFLRGLIFALPMALSVISMLTLKFSLWSYEYLSVDLATCIAIGTILSFLVVGGFTQAIARRGFFYLFQGYYNMGRKMTFTFIRLGYVACLLTAAAVYLFNLVFNLVTGYMLAIIIVYFIFMATIWLSVTVMYILRKEQTFTLLMLVGIGMVYVLFRVFELDILIAQLASMLVVSVVGMALVIYFFKQEERKEEKGIAPKMPRLSLTAYAVMPYFQYGFLYFLFLYVDRVMAWSVNDEFMPFFLWFRGDYELGLDFALLVLMLPLGVTEVVVNKMMLDMEAAQKGYWGFETDKMCRHFLAMYHKWMLATGISAVLSAGLVALLMHVMNGSYYQFSGKYLIGSSTTYFVFICSLIAYMILAVALMNAVILFALSQPKLVSRSILPAVGVNILIGFLLTRWIGYSSAVFGLIVGSIVFTWLSYRQVKRVLSHLDYYLYAAS